jgi:N6-L-threonylcarbamoyladenine synthase
MPVILGIESSCDDTSAAIIKDGFLLSNVIANQLVHKNYGGVVPELASRAHQQNIIPVVDEAIKQAQVSKKDIDAIAFTLGPGLLGSLIVGTSFAKGLSLSLNKPLIDVNHLQGHILSLFIKENSSDKVPDFPFICLLVSGGHTQLVLVKNYLDMKIIGQTIDDAAGEAFDKCAKVLGLPYPGGPYIDKLAQDGNPLAFNFSKPVINDFDFSFSGLKTSFLYFIKDKILEDKNFINNYKNDLCASIQHTITEILIDKLLKATKYHKIKNIGIAGGVAANSALRNAIIKLNEKYNYNVYVPKIKFTTDNAAMIAITGYYKFMTQQFASLDINPVARYNI